MRLEKDLRISTSAPSIGQFYTTFLECFQRGAQAVVYIGLSGRLSGALSAAETAARLVREDYGFEEIAVFDSRLATIAQGFLAIEAARLAGQGAGLQQILSQLEDIRRRTGFVGSLETLEYLARGGRIGKAAYMLSSATHILPVLSMSDEGEVLPICRVIGYQRALEEMVRFVGERVASGSRLSLAVMHADVLQWAERLRALALERLQPDEMLLTDFTPVMAAHSGPGIIGLAYHWRA
jgi:DegV family protein with EDD domain